MRTALLLLPLLVAPALAQDGDIRASKEPTAFEFRRKPAQVKHAIDLKEIIQGVNKPGDPRDAIPPIYKPSIVPGDEAGSFLRPNDRVLGVAIEGEARAYPLFILERHEMVNDRLAGRPIAPNY